MIARIAVTVLAVCLSQAVARSAEPPANMLPHESYGDLNMPGFAQLNTAINMGSLDLAPALAHLPPYAAGSTLSAAISQFFGDLASQCHKRGEAEMAESLEALQSVSPEFELLAQQYALEDESWAMVSAVREVGLSIINLRSQLELSLEVFRDPVEKLLDEVIRQVNDLGSHESVLVVQKRVEALKSEFDIQVAVQVADVAEILRMVARMLADMMNYRVHVTQDMQQIFAAVVRLRADLDNSRYIIGKELKSLETELRSLVSQGVIAEGELVVLGMTMQQVGVLTRREVEDISRAVTFTLETSRVAYEALHNFT